MKILVQLTALLLLLTLGQVVCVGNCCNSVNVTVTGEAAEVLSKDSRAIFRSWSGIYEEDGKENNKKRYKKEAGIETKYLFSTKDKIWVLGVQFKEKIYVKIRQMSAAKIACPDKVSIWEYHDRQEWQDGSDYIKVSCTTKTAGTSAPSTTTAFAATTFPSTTSPNSSTTPSPSMATKDVLLISLAAAAAFAIVGFLIILILYIKKIRKPLIPERVSDKDNKRPLHSMNCHTH